MNKGALLTLGIKNGGSLADLFLPSIALTACFMAACAIDPEPGDPAARHCVSSPAGPATCYATFTEAISAATGGQITDAPADPGAVLDDKQFVKRINEVGHQRTVGANIPSDGPFVIGISYIDGNYHGKTWIWNTPTPCDGDPATLEYWVPNLNTSPYSDSDFNDNISSFHSFNNCQTVLYQDWFFGGNSTNSGAPIGDMNFVGSLMNDQASSIGWY